MKRLTASDLYTQLGFTPEATEPQEETRTEQPTKKTYVRFQFEGYPYQIKLDDPATSMEEHFKPLYPGFRIDDSGQEIRIYVPQEKVGRWIENVGFLNNRVFGRRVRIFAL